MDSTNSQHSFYFFKQPAREDRFSRQYYLQVINALHQYDIFQARETLRTRLPINEEKEETDRHVRWADEIIPIPEILGNEPEIKEMEEEESDNELYAEKNNPDLEEPLPESCERSTLLSLSEQPSESVNYENTDGPFRESESEKEEEFEPPFPNRKPATNQTLNRDKEDFIVPFPRLRHEQRTDKE